MGCWVDVHILDSVYLRRLLFFCAVLAEPLKALFILHEYIVQR